MTLPDDLITIIGTYTTFTVSVSLLTLGETLATSAYSRNGLMWRNKADFETLGGVMDRAVVPDWLLYYQIVNRHHYGELVIPYSNTCSYGGKAVPGPVSITCLANRPAGLVYVDDQAIFHWEGGSSFCSHLKLPRRACRAGLSTYGKFAVVHLECGGLVLVFLEAGEMLVARQPRIGPVRSFRLSGSVLTFITRSGEIGSIDPHTADEAPNVIPGQSDFVSLWTVSGDGIDSSGKLVVGRSGDLLPKIPFPVMVYTRFTGPSGGLGIVLGVDGRLTYHTRCEHGPVFDSAQKFTSINQGHHTRWMLITQGRQIRCFDPDYPDFFSLPKYDKYAGRVEQVSYPILLVSD